MNRILGTATLLVLIGSLALGTTWRQLTLAEMIGAAEVAVHAVVDSSSVALSDGEPWTQVTFTVRGGLAWPAEEDDPDSEWQDPASITLGFLGGTSGGITLNADQVPSFNPGDEVILMAYTGRYYSPVVGFNQAVWWLTDGSWVDRDGRLLDLGDSGELVLGATGRGAGADEVIEALRTTMEAR